jgi:choline dehydrogenase-like flavoprotein
LGGHRGWLLIKNLAASSGPTNVTGKICIIGEGIAGLMLASRLRSHGMHVVVLESGDKDKPQSADALNAVTQLAQVYNGATLGRFRGLGRTSSNWGGELIPMRSEDMAARPHVRIPAWPIEPEKLMRYLPAVEEFFGLCGDTYDQDILDWDSNRFYSDRYDRSARGQVWD